MAFGRSSGLVILIQRADTVLYYEIPWMFGGFTRNVEGNI